MTSARLLIVLLGGVYFIVGVVFGELAKWAGSEQGQFRWRLAAWGVSGAVYAAHIAHEHFRLRSRATILALHVALATALGAFLLAAAATLHALRVVSHAPYWLYLLALVLWPLMTGLPAFVVAFVAAKVLALVSPRYSGGH
jgi:hypothetical protein